MTETTQQLFNFSAASILVVGDISLDTYWHSSSNRISPEAPVAVAHYQNAENRVSGSGLICAIAANLGAKASFISPISKNADDSEIYNTLENIRDDVANSLSNGIDYLKNNNYSYTLPKIADKTNNILRIVSQGQQLVRIENKVNSISDAKELDIAYKEQLNKHNVVIFLDSANGTVNNQYLSNWLDKAKKRNIKTIYIPTNISALDNFIVKSHQADYVILNQNVVKAFNNPADISKISTLYNKGLLIIDHQQGITYTDKTNDNKIIRLQKANSEVENIIGVEEAISAIFALGISANNINKINSIISLSHVAAIYIERQFGQALINITDLQLAYADHLLEYEYNYHKLKQEIKAARDKGNKIVFANGCFDILHVGHVAYLDSAKQRGDKLFVAINSDKSITRLKGHDRPIHNLKDRLNVLSNLTCVDYVVPFFTDTPNDFLAWLKPDTLVKGGDYTIDQVVGREYVEGYGGKVEVIKHPHTAISSTKILAKEL